jgi:hypothetical protein
MEIMFPPESCKLLTRLYGVTLQKVVFIILMDVEASNITLIEENKSTFR